MAFPDAEARPRGKHGRSADSGDGFTPSGSALMQPPHQDDLLLRLAVEYFLYEEAAYLDNWRLDEWLGLFTEDARYIVPTTDRPDGDPKRDVVFIDDDLTRLQGRVNRLKGRHAHREYPYSRT